MDICKRRCSAFENGKNMFASNSTPSAATNLTVTFSSQLNQHNQVSVPSAVRLGLIVCATRTMLAIQFSHVASSERLHCIFCTPEQLLDHKEV